jgi:hypothetical protein
MMKYPAPDGHLVQSLPHPQEVVYTCKCSPTEYPDGIYYTEEIKGAATPIGIQAIHINRIVIDGDMTIKVTEFSEQELIEYIQQNTNQENTNLKNNI